MYLSVQITRRRCNLFRPPTLDTGIFSDKIEQLLVHIFEQQKLIFIVGNINADLIKENKIRTELISIMNTFRLTQTVFQNTRVTKNTSMITYLLIQTLWKLQ